MNENMKNLIAAAQVTDASVTNADRTLWNWERAGIINGVRMSSRRIRFNQADVTRLLTRGAFPKDEV